MKKNELTLITGGTGFIGKRIADKFAEAGIPMRFLVRDPSKLPKNLRSVEIVIGDITDYKIVSKAVAGVEKVIHLVTVYPTQGKDICFKVNIEGTLNLLKASLENKITHFVHFSTTGVMGNLKKIPANEESPLLYASDDPYESSKAEAEQLVNEYGKKGLPVTILRPASVYGPGDLRLLKFFKMIVQKKFFYLGSGNNHMHFVHVDDVARAVEKVFEHPEKSIGEIFIIAGDEILTMRQVCEIVAKEAGVPAPLIRLPFMPFYLAGYLCEAICHPLKINPPIYRSRVRFFINDRGFSTSKIEKNIGYKPMFSNKAGLKETTRDYLDKGLI